MVKKRRISAFLFATMILSLFIVPQAAAEGLSGWEKVFNNGVEATVSIDTEVYYSGDGALKITRESPMAPNVYVMAKTKVKLEAGKKYNISLMAKADKASDFQLMVGWDKRYSLTPLANSYNWTQFEFDYISPTTRDIDIMVLCDNAVNAVWVDNIRVIDVENGNNLITNSTFDSGKKTEIVVEPEFDNSLAGVYNKVTTSDTYTEEDLVKVRGAFKYMPVYKADGITVDGDGGDWDSFPGMAMPVFSDQFQVYIKDGREKDIEATSKFAYDNDNFYIYLEVTDDVFYSIAGESEYWKGDSIQLAFSGLDETYGSELGFIHNMTTGEGEVYGSGFNDAQKKSMILKTSQNENKTVYEAKIPWKTKFSEKPEALYFDYIVNDNDGDGRRYCLELAPGIAEGKTNAQFPYLRIMDSKNDWYSWIQGSRNGYTEDELEFEYFLVNSGGEKTFSITNSQTGETEEITVPEKSGIRKKIKHTFNEWGNIEFKIEAKYGDEKEFAVHDISIQRKEPSKEIAENVVKNLKLQASELKKLIDECEKKGIAHDYELLNYKIIDRFATFVQDDIDHNDLSRIYYTEDTTKELYQKSKADLEAYLSGEKEPQIVPKYVTSDMNMDGIGATATFEIDGKEEERPAFFLGYLDFGRMGDDMESFSQWGHNAYAREAIPTAMMKSSAAWEKLVLANPQYTFETTTEDVKEGNKAVKITFSSELVPNQSLILTQKVAVTPGKTYELKGYIKAGNAENFQVSANNWDDRQVLSGDYDWKEFSVEYVAPEGKTDTIIRFFVDDKADYIYIDDLKFTEQGKKENLLNDGGFEKFGGGAAYEFDYDSPKVQELLEMFEEAEKNNIAISFLVSPHYFPNTLISDAGIAMNGKGFLKYNVNAPEAKIYIETYLRGLIPLIKDYKSLNNICISNEPQFWANGCGDFYLNDWHAYLEEQYGNIEKLNVAYGKNYTSFEEVDMTSDMCVAKRYDYKIFNDMLFTDWHKWMADIIHEIAPDIPLNYKLMGYIENFPTEYIDNGTNYELQHECFDINGCDYHNYMDFSNYKRLRKVMWYDYMTSIKEAPVINSEDHIIPDESENYDLTISDYVAQDIYQGGIHGRFMSTIWFWERTYDKTYDAWGSILYRPDALSTIGVAAFDLNRLAHQITALQKEPAEVGVLHLKANALNNINSPYIEYEAYASALYNGQKVRFIVESQIEKLHDMKLLIVPDIAFVSNNVLLEIKKFIEKGGKVIVSGDGELKLDYDGLPNDEELINFIMENSERSTYSTSKDEIPLFYQKVREILDEIGIYYVSVVDAKTGNPVNDIEYNLGVYEGKVIVNLANYGEERTVNIIADGKAVEKATELRRDRKCGKDITIGKYESITLETDIENVFFDTYGHWAADEITELSNKGIVYGVSSSRFAPDSKTTRWQFHALLSRATGINLPEYDSQSEEFRPNDVITRAEMCEMLVNFAEAVDGEMESSEITFEDNNIITDKESVGKAVKAGLMYGREDGTFDPMGSATRAEASAVINRLLK